MTTSLRQIQTPWLTDVLSTSNATPAVSAACSFSVPDGAMGWVELLAVLRGATTVAPFKVGRPFRCAAGTVTLAGALSTLIAIGGDAGLATALLSFGTDGGRIVQPTVTGILATTIEWTIDCRVWM